jgi:D-alanyl-D-alanine carboxypeptidase
VPSLRANPAVPLSLGAFFAACAHAPPPPKPPPDPQDIPANVDQIAREVLASTGAPSASVAVVVGGKIAYVHAYGDGRIEPLTPSTPAMRYSVGSITKQIVASAILLLAERGKLSLDDAVGKYVPGLTRGGEVTIRQVLSHTSGYQDYWPQDYLLPEMRKPVQPEEILARWAKQPLDFEPGTQWQYSNTNYVIAGRIVEAVSGMRLIDFLTQNIFSKLGMTSVTTVGILPATDAQGVFRRAQGPLHVAEPSGEGWVYACGDLSMTAEDLAKWDVSLIEGSLLSPASQRALATDTLLQNGVGTTYGLGVSVRSLGGHRQLAHDGEVVGFSAFNVVLPDDRIAVAVLTNQDASSAATTIGTRIRDALLKAALPANQESERRIRGLLAGFAQGTLDRTYLTDNASSYFTPEAVAEYQQTLAPLGELQSLEQSWFFARGGFHGRGYQARYREKTVVVSVYEAEDGKLEQFLLEVQ